MEHDIPAGEIWKSWEGICYFMGVDPEEEFWRRWRTEHPKEEEIL